MSPSGVRLVIEVPRWEERPRAGDSVAVAGCCLTVADEPKRDPSGAHFLRFDVVSETLEKTTLGRLEHGARVNIEASLRADSALGGHMVQGHIEGIGVVESVSADAADWRLVIRPPGALMPCIVPKGSVAVDGVSLTVAAAARDSFSVALIPTTLERTTLGALRPGGACNIETDILARTVVHFMRNYSGSAAE